MFNKLIYGLFVILMGYTTFLFFQNKALREKTYEIVAINDYKSLSYLIALEHNKSSDLRQMLIADIDSFVLNYDKNIYLNNTLLKNICNDIDKIKDLLGNVDLIKIKIIKKDCQKKKDTCEKNSTN